jgi:hypothetical protein
MRIMYRYCFGQCPCVRCVTCVVLPLTVELVYHDVYVAQWYPNCKTDTFIFIFKIIGDKLDTSPANSIVH